MITLAPFEEDISVKVGCIQDESICNDPSNLVWGDKNTVMVVIADRDDGGDCDDGGDSGDLQSPAELERLHPAPVQTVLLPPVGSSSMTFDKVPKE